MDTLFFSVSLSLSFFEWPCQKFITATCQRCGGPPSDRGAQLAQVCLCSCCSKKEGRDQAWFLRGFLRARMSTGESTIMLLSSARGCSCCLFCFYLDTELQTTTLKDPQCLKRTTKSISNPFRQQKRELLCPIIFVFVFGKMCGVMKVGRVWTSVSTSPQLLPFLFMSATPQMRDYQSILSILIHKTLSETKVTTSLSFVAWRISEQNWICGAA